MTRLIEPLTRCVECPLRTLDAFRQCTPDPDFMQAMKAGEMMRNPGETIIPEGETVSNLYTMLSGWAFRYKTLPDGRRQIFGYSVAGDLVGLQASMLDAMSHGVEALTPVVLCVFPRERFWSVSERHPSIAYDVTWLSAREEHALEEALLSIGRRSALERTAFFLWYIFDKGRTAGLTHEQSLLLPVTQTHIADTLGQSLVHTNKTLQKLRTTGVASLEDRLLRVHDEDALLLIAKIERTPPRGRPLL